MNVKEVDDLYSKLDIGTETLTINIQFQSAVRLSVNIAEQRIQGERDELFKSKEKGIRYPILGKKGRAIRVQGRKE